MANVDEFLRTRQFQVAPGGLPPSAARPSTPAPGLVMGDLGRLGAMPGPPAPPATASAPGLDAILAALGPIAAASSAAPGPVPAAPPAAEPATGRAISIEKLIAKALANTQSDRKPLSISAATLDALGIDAPTLVVAAGHLNLRAVLNFDRQGGVLISRSPKILQDAERLRDQGTSVPVIPVRVPSARQAALVREQGERPSTGSTVVRPLAPTLERARRDKARQHLRAARTVRGHQNYDE